MTEIGTVPPYVLRSARKQKLLLYGSTPIVDAQPVVSACEWLPVGPRNVNGRVRCLVVDPTDASTLYAGTAAGGVWKTEDGGQSWFPTMHAQASLAIGALAVDASGTIYAGTGEPIYWEKDGSFRPPTSGDVAWFYEGDGVLKSTDGGDTWSTMGTIANDYIYRIAIDPTNSDRILCAGFSSTVGTGGLCLWSAGSWVTIKPGIFTDVLFDPDGKAYAAEYGAGIWKFEPGGGRDLNTWSDWSAFNSGILSTTLTAAMLRRISLAIAPSDRDVLYARIEKALAFGSSTRFFRLNGSSWEEKLDPGAGQPWWCLMVEVDPANPNIVYGGGQDLYRSIDGGWTWGPVNQYADGTFIHMDHHDLIFTNVTPRLAYLAGDGGVFRGDEVLGGNLIWTKTSTGLVSTQFYDVSFSKASPTMYGGGSQDNGTLITTGGQSWRQILGGDGASLVFHPTDCYMLWAQAFLTSTTEVSLSRSTDGGATTSPGDPSNTIADKDFCVFPATPLTAHPTNPEILFIGTKQVWKTENATSVSAAVWSPKSPDIGGGGGPSRDVFTAIAVAPSDGDVVYAGSLRGLLFQATNGGDSFTDITPTVDGFPQRWISKIAVHPTDPYTIYVTFLGVKVDASGNLSGSSDQVWRGEFAAGSWTWDERNAGINVPTGAVAIAADGSLYLATDVGVFWSQNEGMDWSPLEPGLPTVPAVDLALNPAGDKLVVATHGRGMYQMSLQGPCLPIDVYVRDNSLDTGEIMPSPSGVPDPTQPGSLVRFYKSADIKVDAPPFTDIDGLLDGVEFDAVSHAAMPRIETIAGIEHEQPIRGATNKVYVQVHNRGPSDVSDVVVKLLFADAAAGLPPLPADFWTNFPGDSPTSTSWTPIGTAQPIATLLANTPHVLEWTWPVPTSASDHVCILAMVHCLADPLLPETETDVDQLTLYNKHVTHRNVHPVSPASPHIFLQLYLHNPFKDPASFDIRLEPIHSACERMWLVLPEPAIALGLRRSARGLRRVRADAVLDVVTDGTLKRRLDSARVNELFTAPAAVFEVDHRKPLAELRGVRLASRARLDALVIVQVRPGVPKGTPVFDLTQVLGSRLLGGSQATLAESTTTRVLTKD